MKVEDLRELAETTVFSRDGRPIGDLAAVHANQASDVLFVEIDSGRTAVHFVAPALDAQIRDGRLSVAHTAARVRRGPTVFIDDALALGFVTNLLQYYSEPETDAPESPDPEKSDTGLRPEPAEQDRQPIVKFVAPAVADLVFDVGVRLQPPVEDEDG